MEIQLTVQKKLSKLTEKIKEPLKEKVTNTTNNRYLVRMNNRIKIYSNMDYMQNFDLFININGYLSITYT